jgi:hypothetical protein
MKLSADPSTIVDLDLHWDARAQEIARPEKYLNNPLCKRRLEDYFDFLADVKPAQNIKKQPAEVYARKFSF